MERSWKKHTKARQLSSRDDYNPVTLQKPADSNVGVVGWLVELTETLEAGGVAEAQLTGGTVADPVRYESGETIYVSNPVGEEIESGTIVPVMWCRFISSDGPAGMWVPVSAGASSEGGSGDDCTCKLIELLQSHDHLSDITQEEWDELAEVCECNPAAEYLCEGACDPETPNPSYYRVQFTGSGLVVPPDFASLWTEASYQGAIDYLTSRTFRLYQNQPAIEPCTYSYIEDRVPGTINVGSDQDGFGLKLQVGITLEKDQPGGLPGNLRYNVSVRYTEEEALDTNSNVEISTGGNWWDQTAGRECNVGQSTPEPNGGVQGTDWYAGGLGGVADQYNGINLSGMSARVIV